MHTGPVWLPRAWQGQWQQGQCPKGLVWPPELSALWSLSLQNQTKWKPNQSRSHLEKREWIQLFKNRDFGPYKLLVRTVAGGRPHSAHYGDSVWSIGCPPPLCSLASGQCLLSQSSLNRFLWNQNLVVVLWYEERNKDPWKGEDELICYEFFKVPGSDLLSCSPRWRVVQSWLHLSFDTSGTPETREPSCDFDYN